MVVVTAWPEILVGMSVVELEPNYPSMKNLDDSSIQGCKYWSYFVVVACYNYPQTEQTLN